MPGEPVASVSAPRVRLSGGSRVDGLTASELGSRKARTLPVALALARGDPVGVDRLVEVVWGDEPPARPADQLGNQAPDATWRQLLAETGFSRFRRATKTPFNRIFEVRP